MIPINPCGRAVDWGRRPYTTTARLFNSPDAPTVKIRWYVTDQPFQEFPSFVNSLDLDEEPHRPRTLGEVYGTPRRFNGLWAVPGLRGGHQCGEPHQFLQGVPYDPDREPIAVGPDWIPACCPRDPIGNAVVGVTAAARVSVIVSVRGNATVGVSAAGRVRHVASVRGNATLGVSVAGDAQRVVIVDDAGATIGVSVAGDGQRLLLAEGGATIGVSVAGDGQRLLLAEGGATIGVSVAGDAEVDPGEVTPGTDCASAPTVGLGETHGATIGTLGSHWWKVSGLSSGTTYHITTTGLNGISQPSASLSRGDNCGSRTFVGFAEGDGCASFVMGAGAFLYVSVQANPMAAGGYTFSVSAGGCT